MAKKTVSINEEKIPVTVKPAEPVVVPAEKTAKVETVKKPDKVKATKKQADKEVKTQKSTEEVFIQFGPDEYLTQNMIDKAKELFIGEGHRVSTIKTLRIYVKPEEKMAYYVINDKSKGRFEI